MPLPGLGPDTARCSDRADCIHGRLLGNGRQNSNGQGGDNGHSNNARDFLHFLNFERNQLSNNLHDHRDPCSLIFKIVQDMCSRPKTDLLGISLFCSSFCQFKRLKTEILVD
jgi:hypothetical protein